MTKRILILTDGIAPPAYAPRIVSLCRHLTDKGYQCDVFSDCEQGCKPFSAPFGRWFNTAYYQAGDGFLHYVNDKLLGARERQFYAFIESTVNVADYDAIFCSTCYYFPLQTTRRLAKKYHKPFVVDIRDVAEQFGDHPFRTRSICRTLFFNELLHRFYTAYSTRRRNKVLAAAKHVITVSPWHQALLRRFNPNTHLIYNGFDEKEFYPKDVPSDRFIISYSGKLYDLAFRDPTLLFEALQQLLAHGQIKREDLQIVFHINESAIDTVRRFAEKYHMEDLCDVGRYIPHNELLALMHRSSILLVLACKSTPKGAHGIMGTKFYEAIGVEKPVLCVRSDEECLAQVIDQTQAGLAGTNVQEVADFILAQYHEWQTNGFTRSAPRDRDLFTRRTQSDQILRLLLDND